MENKDEEHLKIPEIQMTEFFWTNPYLLNFFKSMLHDPKMNQHIKKFRNNERNKRKRPRI